ncbi:MAG: formate/nitrite transporter family protein [Oscillospiraceae bacterium]|jgi:formate/nitrite transporter|nr:formate/nitrite transporter family protein [Oscillospiraceae bacterium]
MNSPKEVAANYVQIGVAKTKLPVPKMFILAVLAGMFIALAGAGATIAGVTVQSASLAKLLGAMVFPAGLAMVLVAGSELFTGNNLIIISVLEKQARLSKMLVNWLVVYIGNFAGAVIVAWLAVRGGTFDLFSNAAGVAVVKAAAGKVSLGFGDAVARGILCNFLVCIAVWISFAAKDVVGKIIGLYLPIMLFVLSGYEHSVANMYYIAAGIFGRGNPFYLHDVTGTQLVNLNWGGMFAKNLLPVTLGNIIGGVVFVGVFYWFVYLQGANPPTDGKKPVKKK